MKKVLWMMLTLLFCFSVFTACAAGANNTETGMLIQLQMSSAHMTVNGIEKEIDPGRNTTPVVVDGRTLLPARAIVEEMGGAVGWDESTQTAVFTCGEEEIRLTVGSGTAYINGDERPAIQSLNVDFSQYDTVILGYPIWWGQCPPVVRTFLADTDLSGKTIMPFCTSGSSGIGGSLGKIRELAPNSVVTDGFRGTSTTAENQIASWLAQNGFNR